MKRAIIYARVSSTNDRQSTERQVQELSAYADKNDYGVVEIFEEKISGIKKNKERPILSECLNFVANNKIDCILCSELSRLGRNCDEVLKNVLWCKDTHVNIYFQKECLSLFREDGTENPYVNIMISVLATAAQMERENIKFRLNSGRAKYIAEGGRLGRPQNTKMTVEQIKIKYSKVIKELKRGTSIERTAKYCDVSKSTVQRIKKTLGI